MNTYSAVMTEVVHEELQKHLLQHYRKRYRCEDLCFALWVPSTGHTRTTAIIKKILLPRDGERNLHGNVSFNSCFLERAFTEALTNGMGIAFLHSHPVSGWQDMSPDDVNAEKMLAPRIMAITGLPLVGLTMGTCGTLSARWWIPEGKGYKREWCPCVRVVGDRLKIYFADFVPKPDFLEQLKRTYSAWGKRAQDTLARLKYGVIGAGSVGAIIAEALVRQGSEDVKILDFDEVKIHNLDRLLHATLEDVGKKKVDLLQERLTSHATSSNCQVNPIPVTLCSAVGFKHALDCDVIFSCVDRPWPREVLDFIAYAHLIPVIDGGISVRVMPSGQMRGADWRSHVVGFGKRCMKCLGQYTTQDVALEKTGLLDDPKYIQGLPLDHFIHGNQNVFSFALNAAGMMMLKMIQFITAPSGVADTGPVIYSMSTGQTTHTVEIECNSDCCINTITSTGDTADNHYLSLS